MKAPLAAVLYGLEGLPMRLFFAILISLLPMAVRAATLDIAGVWQTPKGAHVEISDCGDGTPCGRIIRLEPGKDPATTRDEKNEDASLRDRLLLGVEMLSGFQPQKARWVAGRVYNPKDGGTYSGSVWLTDGNTMKLKGCIIWPACKTQKWTRVGPAARPDGRRAGAR